MGDFGTGGEEIDYWIGKREKKIDLGTKSQESGKKSFRELVAKKLNREPRVKNQEKCPSLRFSSRLYVIPDS
jgi:hypothetical protein